MSDLAKAHVRGVEQSAPLRLMSAVEARKRLEAETAGGNGAGEGRKAKALALSAIETVECLFQPREIAEAHVTGMVSGLKAGGELPALLVYWTGGRVVLLDGHHRREAYRRAKRAEAVPVEWFRGNLDAAIAEAGARNCQEKLPMTPSQRSNFAWKLVTLCECSIAETSRASSVSPRQVAVMRGVRKMLEATEADSAVDFKTWWQAREAAKGNEGWAILTDDERDERLEAHVRDLTLRIHKAVGNKLTDNPEVAAKVLARLLGRKLTDVVGFLLKEHVSKGELEERLYDGDLDSDF